MDKDSQIEALSADVAERDSQIEALNADAAEKNSQIEDRFEIKEAKDGSPFFNLKSSNGQIIGSSQMYSSERSMKEGIASVMKNAPEAEVVEELEQ